MLACGSYRFFSILDEITTVAACCITKVKLSKGAMGKESVEEIRVAGTVTVESEML